MGVNNKQRRAAKQRRRTTNESAGAAGARRESSKPGPGSSYEQVRRTLESLLIVLAGRKIEELVLSQAVRALLSNPHPHPTAVAREVLEEKLCSLVGPLVLGGWVPPTWGNWCDGTPASSTCRCSRPRSTMTSNDTTEGGWTGAR